MMINGTAVLATATKCYSKIADVIRAEKRWQNKSSEKPDVVSISPEAREMLASEKVAAEHQSEIAQPSEVTDVDLPAKEA